MDWETTCFVTLIVSILNFIFALIRTYYNIRVTHGSEKYWASWKERSKDVARKVLKEISTVDLEKELKRRTSRKKKRRKRKKRVEKKKT